MSRLSERTPSVFQRRAYVVGSIVSGCIGISGSRVGQGVVDGQSGGSRSPCQGISTSLTLVAVARSAT